MQQGEFLTLSMQGGSGATDTITRAELAAIAYALLLVGQEQGKITDRQASTCMIAKYMTLLKFRSNANTKSCWENHLPDLLVQERACTPDSESVSPL